MRKILLVLALLLVLPLSVQADGWRDPFSCDPYVFPFDFAGGYDSAVIPMLIRSNLGQDQQLSISMWPEYYGPGAAPSEWFTIEPETAVLPANGIAAVNIRCTPFDYEEKVYVTYLRVSRTIDGQNYWERALTVRVRFGSAIPVVEYSVEGWKCTSIMGNEGTDYTQDQLTIRVTNKSFTPNWFVIYPVLPSPPTTDNIQTTNESYLKLLSLWRDPEAQAVYAEPIGDVNQSSGKYDRYRLYLEKGSKQVEFGEFLAAAYDRDTDVLNMSIYPFKLAPRESKDIPFTLRVLKSVPSGIYRLQFHVGPSGESAMALSMSTQYQCKVALEITREQRGGPFVWMLASLVGLGLLGLIYFGWRQVTKMPPARARVLSH